MWEEQPSTSSQISPKKSSLNKKLFLYGGIGFLIIALVAVSGYFFLQYQNAQKQLSNGASQAEVQKVLEKVGKLVELPKDEKPTLASVTDKFKLNNQPFFAKTENGDQVLIYTKNKTAVLFRPSTGKIVNYSTGVTIGQGATEEAPEQEVGGVTAAPTGVVEPTEAPATRSTARPTVIPTATQPSPTP